LISNFRIRKKDRLFKAKCERW